MLDIITYSKEQKPPWKANRSSASQEVSRILWNPMVRYRVSHYFKIRFNIFLPPTPGSSKWSPALMSPHQNPVCTPPLPHTCHVTAHLILFYLIKLTIFGEDHRSWSSSLCTFLHSPVASSLVVPYIFLSTLFSNTLSLLSSLNVSDQLSHPYKTTGKITVFYVSSSWHIILQNKVRNIILPNKCISLDRNKQWNKERTAQNVESECQLIPTMREAVAAGYHVYCFFFVSSRQVSS